MLIYRCRASAGLGRSTHVGLSARGLTIAPARPRLAAQGRHICHRRRPASQPAVAAAARRGAPGAAPAGDPAADRCERHPAHAGAVPGAPAGAAPRSQWQATGGETQCSCRTSMEDVSFCPAVHAVKPAGARQPDRARQRRCSCSTTSARPFVTSQAPPLGLLGSGCPALAQLASELAAPHWCWHCRATTPWRPSLPPQASSCA